MGKNGWFIFLLLCGFGGIGTKADVYQEKGAGIRNEMEKTPSFYLRYVANTYLRIIQASITRCYSVLRKAKQLKHVHLR